MRQTTLNEACRGTSRFLTETALTTQVFKVVGLGCRAVQAESMALMNELRAERAAESIIATTVEGLEVRAAQAVENAMLSEAQDVVKQGIKTSESIVQATENFGLKAGIENSTLNKTSEFSTILETLSTQYGKANVDKALDLLKITENVLVTKPNSLVNLEKFAQELSKINSNNRWAKFMLDAAHGGKATLNSIREAMAGIACETQNLLKAPLSRSLASAEEFFDALKQAWDVKSAISYSLEGKSIINAQQFVNKLKNSLSLGKENIIVNITDLTISDLEKLYCQMSSLLDKTHLERTVLVHAYDANLSKTSEKLIQFLGK